MGALLELMMNGYGKQGTPTAPTTPAIPSSPSLNPHVVLGAGEHCVLHAAPVCWRVKIWWKRLCVCVCARERECESESERARARKPACRITVLGPSHKTRRIQGHAFSLSDFSPPPPPPALALARSIPPSFPFSLFLALRAC